MEKKTFKEKILLITYAIVLFVFLMNYHWVVNVFKYLWKILTPFIMGGIIAFIVNVLVNLIEKNLLFKMKKGKRACSIILSLLIIFSILSILVGILVPQIKGAGKIFVDNLPKYKETVYNLGTKWGLSEEVLDVIDFENVDISKEVSKYLYRHSDSALPIIFGYASSVMGVIGNIVVGIIFAIYLLSTKESLSRQIKKLLKKICKKDKYDRILEIASLTNDRFTNYVKIQVTEACILGILCFIGMLILRLPYAAPISVIIGFTALIPIFGSLIGGAVGVFLIFMVNPVKAIIFLVFYLILQQVETNGIYPKVVGDKINLPGIWVLVAVSLGGTIWGVLGMLIGVPTCSVIYQLLKEYVNGKKETSK
ncbi:MAG: AI-2E family transporter [Bacilli bacterium]|nr:AI-2E family transporter [Bacilli bacterium]